MARAGSSSSAEALVSVEEVRAERTRILSALLEDVDALTDTAVGAIGAEIPAYAAQGARFFEDVHDQVRLHYRTMLASFLEDREVTLEDIAFVRGAATRRARAGVALEDYLNAYRVGQQVLWDAIVALGDETPAGHEGSLTLVMPLMRYTNFASTHAGHAYVEFQQYLVADADRERRDLLEYLLSGEPLRGPMLGAAQTYSIGPDSRLMVAAAVPVGHSGDSVVLHAASAAVARAGLHPKTLVVVRQAEIVAVPVLNPGADASQLCDRLEAAQQRLSREGIPLAIGVSTVASGVGDLPRAYAEAQAALELVSDGGGVAALPRLSPFDYLALRADDTARRLVDPRVRAFLHEERRRGGPLVATIAAFAKADLNLRVAAERLQIHPNTAQYRLRRIEERTGRNPRDIAHLLDLLVAIALEDGDGSP